MEIRNNDTIRNRWLQFFILLSAPLLTVIDVFIVNISLPSIQESLNATNAQLELIITAYLLGYASFMVTGGRAGDYFGRKKIFLWSMIAFVITSCLCGLTTSAEILIISRFFQGVSGGFMTPQTLSYLQFLFPEAKARTKAVGYLGITLGTASTIGQFLGGYLSSLNTFFEGWRFIFFINLPLGAIAVWGGIKYLTDTPRHKHKFDFLGIILIITALGTLIYPLTEGRELGWPWWSFAFLSVSLLLFFIFVTLQGKLKSSGKEPLVDLSLFSIRGFNLGILSATFYFMVHTSYLLISTLYIQKGLGIGAFETGLYFVSLGVAFMLSSFWSIRLVNRFGVYPVQAGLLLMGICYTLQLFYFGEHPTALQMHGILFFTGFGGGLVLPTLVNLSLKKIPPTLIGTASGVYNTVQQVASTIGICLVGGIFFNFAETFGSVVVAFQYTMMTELVMLSVVFIFISLLGRKK